MHTCSDEVLLISLLSFFFLLDFSEPLIYASTMTPSNAFVVNFQFIFRGHFLQKQTKLVTGSYFMNNISAGKLEYIGRENELQRNLFMQAPNNR